MKTIVVTGGCGYIGSHTIVDLIESGFKVISIDDNSRSNANVLNGIKNITGQLVDNYKLNLCNLPALQALFSKIGPIAGIIHFAAYKAVGESVEQPLLYYKNNLESLVNILQCCQEFKIPHFVFSSSCTVYGNPKDKVVTENTPQQPAASPYGATKQMGEQIVIDAAQQGAKSILLRYFNPVGAHPSNMLGETPIGKPANLVPAITQTAIGKLPTMQVHGSDYDTVDGSCIRDYVHVCDIAHAHTLALAYLIEGRCQAHFDVFNLGSGNGYSVLQAIEIFEKVSGKKLPYMLGPRRAGDVVAIYANNTKAMETLRWQPKYNLQDMLQTAWAWEKKLAENNN